MSTPPSVETALPPSVPAPIGPLPSIPAPVPAMELVIRPLRGWISVDWRELLRYRELLYFLTWRDVKVRYKQTVLGVAWAILQPLFSMVVFTLIFGNFAGIKDRLPPALADKYPLFVYAGLLPWLFFSGTLMGAANSLLSQQNLLTKVYFPRLFVPTAAAGAPLVDLCLSGGVFAALMIYYHATLSWGAAFLPLLVGLTALTALGMGYLLSAMVIRYRDVRFLLPFMIQAWMYLSPVVYPFGMIKGHWRWVLALNPMVGLINGYRAALFGPSQGMRWDLPTLGIAVVVSSGLFLLGVFYFRRTERLFADIA